MAAVIFSRIRRDFGPRPLLLCTKCACFDPAWSESRRAGSVERLCAVMFVRSPRYAIRLRVRRALSRAECVHCCVGFAGELVALVEKLVGCGDAAR